MQRAEARPIRVLLVEDSATVWEAIASEFEADARFEVVGQAGSVAEARDLLAEAEVAILDLGLPDGSGADLIPELRRANPNAGAIVLTATYDRGLHL
jgi:DNA-binding NarL/FixJ family response regulator